MENGIICIPLNPDISVLDSIKKDAVIYKTSEPDLYAEALLFYARTSSTDGHPEVIEILFEADSAEPAQAADEEDEDGEGGEDNGGQGRDATGNDQSRSNL